ncbi:serine/threonine-protein kinase [Mycobacterium sp. ITM-2016-00316]|uniref:serine/threonine-protein kinase n=1 Tax=Mycobacterium sp. ITM-2016-00316 TaxID=2099695 RepID=UPI000CF85648|nr:serine/threonine-protein kinase [Mycobacterium sp. ITM-2016-00316]WNG79979.1 serine/threonine-protein kinase [Mycobacterium sp. ITM-2016-00316]
MPDQPGNRLLCENVNVVQLIDDVSSALGFEDAQPLRQGGQKLVLKGTLSGAPAVAKIVVLSPGPNGGITLQRAHREVELLSAVDSNRVVKVLTDAVEIGDPPTAVCWAEEYLDGADLSDHLNAAWDESAVWTLLEDLAEALSACHDLDVVHRDLSPANVRRMPDGHFVLMDPGLARHLEKTALTGGFQPGTAGWRSPEHVAGGNPMPASDIFALGILAFYALTCQFPIDPNGDAAAYDRALAEQQAPRISTLLPGLSDELAEVIDTCLSRQQARRYLDGAELKAALDAARAAR